MKTSVSSWSFVCAAFVALGCGGGDGGTQADRFGVGAECNAQDDCDKYEVPEADGGEATLECLTEGFKGGYCGLTGCTLSAECPEGAICVAHDDGMNYCFRKCLDKPECNANRTVDNESNCSSSFDWARPADDDGGKACIPPSSDK